MAAWQEHHGGMDVFWLQKRWTLQWGDGCFLAAEKVDDSSFMAFSMQKKRSRSDVGGAPLQVNVD